MRNPHQAVQRGWVTKYNSDPLAVLMPKVWTTAFDPEEVRQVAGEVLEESPVHFRNLRVADARP
jgi:hypothetical protein